MNDHANTVKDFQTLFPDAGKTVYSIAPASIVLLGDHTHYNEGIQLTFACDRYVKLGVGKRNNSFIKINFRQNNYEFGVETIETVGSTGIWTIDYAVGLIKALKNDFGFNSGLYIFPQIDEPESIGLGMRVAFLVSLFKSLNALFKFKVSVKESIQYCREIEYKLIGKISNHAHFFTVNYSQAKLLQIDLRSMQHKSINEFFGDYDIAICDTALPIIKPELTCNERIEECAIGVQGLRLYIWGIKSLRDVKEDFLKRHINMLPRRIFNRCIYNVNERDRVLDAARAIRKKSTNSIGEIMFKSHESLSTDYEISSPEVDFAVNFAMKSDYVIGAKLISCSPIKSTINILQKDTFEKFSKSFKKSFQAEFKQPVNVYKLNLAKGFEFVNNTQV
ncbi:MAG: hypothetical protein K9J12_13275 [Melioribacteraceae bacterium]|nr:hypothetical protein [Melioribacteraceae bacterium]MCF8263828.1 hypothetical protein [Melioribacteraceae bacterium]MCF8412509.1 hypothetical protein [Melioribacteraceae bacterium]